MADNIKDPFEELGFQSDEGHSTPEGFVPDDMSSLQAPKEEPSQLLAAERGLEQGASLGFSDELRGALQAVPEAITGDQGLADLYRQYRDLERSKLKGLQEAHPYTYGASELAGGALTPGLGMLGEGATLAKAAGKGLQLGALTGIGVSEGDLTKGEVAPVATSAVTGGVLGAGGGLLGGLIGKAAQKGSGAKIAKESEILDKMKEAYRLEKKGIPVTSDIDRQTSAKDLLAAAEKLKTGFEETSQKTGAELGQAYKEAQASGLNLQDPVIKEMTALKQELQNLAGDITSPSRKAPVNDAINEIDSLLMKPGDIVDGKQLYVPRDNITPGQLRQFRESMKARGIIAKGQGFDDFAELTGKASKAAEKASNILKENVPGAKELSAKVSASKSGEELLSLVNDVFLKKDIKNTEQVANLIAGLEKAGIKGQSTLQILNTLRDKALQAGNPELAKYIEESLPDLAKRYDLSQAVGKRGFKEFGQTVEGMGIRGAAYLGKAAKAAPEVMEDLRKGIGLPKTGGIPQSIKNIMTGAKEAIPGSPEQRGVVVGREAAAQYSDTKRTNEPANISKNLYTADKESLSQASDVLSGSDNPKVQNYGKALKNAIDNGNTALKNAVLFQISQDPKAREMLHR